MRRLIVLLALALSLALSSGPAFAVQAVDCPMASSSSTMSHDDMGCCKPTCSQDCATLCPGAVMPFKGNAVCPAEPVRQQITVWGVTELQSIDLASTDPPPRTIAS